MRTLRIDAIILAAGTSSRLGRSKQLLPLAGKPLLQHVVDAAAQGGFGEVVVITGSDASAVKAELSLPRNARLAHNSGYSTGQASSLAAGLRALSPETDAAAVLLGDQPGVDATLIGRVKAAFLAAEVDAARPIYTLVNGRIVPGHPVILARELWPQILAFTGDTGARAVLSKHPERLLEVPIDGMPPPDIDTEDDYQRLLEEYEDK